MPKVNDKKLVRLSSGEVDPAGGILAQTTARNLFLHIVTELAPKVLDDLKNEPFRLFCYAGLDKYPPNELVNLWEQLSNGEHQFVDPRILKFYGGLQAWARRHDIEAQWIVERGFFTLDRLTYPNLDQGWLVPSDNKETIPPPSPPVDIPAYYPTAYRRKEYLAFVRSVVLRKFGAADPILRLADPISQRVLIESIVKRFEKYCKEVEAHAIQLGAKPVLIKPEIINHVTWAVRMRVLHEEPASIADSVELDERAIRKSVRKVLLLIGLPPDSEKRGRPKGSKDSKSRHTVSRK
jgi:hypothetical protein